MSKKSIPTILKVMGWTSIAYGIYRLYKQLIFILRIIGEDSLSAGPLFFEFCSISLTVLVFITGKILLKGRKDSRKKFKKYGIIFIVSYIFQAIIFSVAIGSTHFYMIYLYFRLFIMILVYIIMLLILSKKKNINDYFKNLNEEKVKIIDRKKSDDEITENKNITEEKKEVSKISGARYEETTVLNESNLKEEKRHNENKNSEEDDIKIYQLKNGVIRSYYENGALRIEENYVNNILEGQAVEYHSTGRIKSKGLYSNGNKIGKWKYYDEKGVPLEDEEY